MRRIAHRRAAAGNPSTSPSNCAKGHPLTLDELLAREGVRDTYARYNHAGDRGRLEELADCFAADGVLEVRNRFTATGRDEIVDSLKSVSGELTHHEPPPGTRHIVRHYVANLLFTDVSATRVESTAYYVVFLADAADHWGRYRDVLVPVDGRWLFAHRLVTVDGGRAESLALLRG